jgi:tripartite-type tricarboxylate transporter receptor subunit TctC
MRRKTFILAGSVAWAVVLALSCGAAEYPAQDIKMVIGFAPGGASDLDSRIMSQYMGKYLGVNLIPDYKPGAGGTIAIKYLINSKPDGLTIISGNPASCNVFYTKVLKGVDFGMDAITPLFGYADIPLFVVVKADAPWKTMNDFIAEAKKKPKHYRHGSWGAQSTAHFTMAAIGHYTSMQTNHVPFKSSGEALTALLGGHVDIAAVTGFGGGLMKSGKIRPLASATDRRIIDSVPTLKELGYPVILEYIHAMWAPNGTPRQFQDKLIEAGKKAFQNHAPELERDFANIEVLPKFVGQEDYKKHMIENEKVFDFLIDLLKIPTYHKK